MSPPVIIPAAGLGTRLGALTQDTPKELLPIGGRPVIEYALDAVARAGVSRLAVVVAGRSDRVRRHVEARAPAGVELVFATQPEPVGTADAVERGRRALGVDRYAVLYPDYLNPPAQDGLAQLLGAAAARPRATWFALARMTPLRRRVLGPTTQVETIEMGHGVHRVTRAERAGTAGELQTVYAEVRGPAHQAWLDAGRFADADVWTCLNALADQGLYFGVELRGDVLDIGIPAGHAHAREVCG